MSDPSITVGGVTVSIAPNSTKFTNKKDEEQIIEKRLPDIKVSVSPADNKSGIRVEVDVTSEFITELHKINQTIVIFKRIFNS